MTSKLFHTVVGIGISLGAMSMGCAAEPSTDSSTTESADYSTNGTEPAGDPGTTNDNGDRFCEVAWPTTKGGSRPAKAQQCIDPKNECGTYPGGIFSQDQCTYGADVNSCDFDKQNVWMFCKDTADGPTWTCPTGTIPQAQCVAEPDPTPDPTTNAPPPASTSSPAQN